MGAAVPIIMALIQEGPAAIAFVTQTYKLFTDGKIGEDDLLKMWQTSAAAVKAADAKWQASA